jgi:hypothetical protein
MLVVGRIRPCVNPDPGRLGLARRSGGSGSSGIVTVGCARESGCGVDPAVGISE